MNDDRSKAAALLGSIRSKRKAASSRRNGQLYGGRKRIYPACPRYKNRAHRFDKQAKNPDRCPCGYIRTNKGK